MSIFISYIFFVIVIFVFSISLFERAESMKVLVITCFALFVYTLFALVAHYSYLDTGLFFQNDENFFFPTSDKLGAMDSLSSIFKESFTNFRYSDLPGAVFLMGTISYIANNFFEGNNVFLQVAHIVFLSSLIPMFVYKILRYFVDVKHAVNATYVWILCSHVLSIAPWILRDIHITLLYAIAMSIMFSNFKPRRLIALMLLIVVISTFRLENGLFAMFMPLLYYYEHARKSKSAKMVFILSFSLVAVLGGAVFIKTMFSIIESMSGYTSRALDAADGFGRYILLLPPGIKHIVKLGYSTIFPFPSWFLFKDAQGALRYIIATVYCISPVFWFVVCMTVCRALFKKSYMKSIPLILKLSGLVYIIYILAVSSEFNIRRMMCMFPIVYIYYVIAKVNESKRWITSTKVYALLSYLSLCALYVLLKV